MSYYDSTVASYDTQINNNNQRIIEYNQRIRQLEDDIEDLNKVKIRVVDLDSALTTATEKTSRRINNLPALIINPFSFLKMNYFANFLDVIQGNDHKKAKNGIENALFKIDFKIKELKREIEELRAEINRCNSNIGLLTRQKSDYITETTAPKQESTEIKQKAENETTEKSIKKTPSKSSKKSSKKKK